jgi:RnfABCDGE-type electron transport complex B subunit
MTITTVTLILAGVVLGITGIAMGWILGWANRAFHVPTDPKVDALNEVLPGANCGGCGYVGCNEYAEAVAKGEAGVNLCAPGGAGCAAKVAGIMGVEVGEAVPVKAVIHCGADRSKRKQLQEYTGEHTCASANLVAGVQGCTYGCLGFGDCVEACPYDAISLANGLAVVDYDKCVGCRACEKTCPRNIISMVPFKKSEVLVVACSNQDMGPVVKEVCSVGCIGCKACTRPSEGQINMKGNIPEIDYDTYEGGHTLEAATEKCRMESLVYVVMPSAADIAAAGDDEVPERIEADFKTTVDDTEWRG